MYTKNKTSDRKDRRRDDSDMPRTDDTRDMREANENIRKSQGENSTPEKSFGRRPMIDRDR